MVRLKLKGVKMETKKITGLNSTMVRLKLCHVIHGFLTRIRSQFHYGSIKTFKVRFKQSKIDAGLNSTMVRLKPLWIATAGSQISKSQFHKDSFEGSQFHYGSIKTSKIYFLSLCTEISLNSTMVRLKRKKQTINKKFVRESQFHYGSIKTRFFKTLQYGFKKSQFHYGSIKTIIGFQTVMNSTVVSIPLWFD